MFLRPLRHTLSWEERSDARNHDLQHGKAGWS